MDKIEQLESTLGIPQLELRFITEEELLPPLESVGLYLFDLTVLFELHLANSAGNTSAITRFNLYRNHPRVADENRLRVTKLTLASPLEVLTVIAASSAAIAAAIWSVVQALERLTMLPLNRQKIQAEIAKLAEETRKLENERLRLGQVAQPPTVIEAIPQNAIATEREEPTPDEVIASAERRVRSHGIRLRTIEVQFKSDPTRKIGDTADRPKDAS